MQFLHEKNIAGQTLLRLVARGNAIIAELLRLSELVPEPWKLQKDSESFEYYSQIIIDFNYLDDKNGKGPDYYERIIESNPQLQAYDVELKENFIKKLKRFYELFEVIYKYGLEFVQYLNDIDTGTYIQQTLEGILLDENGKQLMCEALYLCGVMLLLLDQRIDGIVRERMLVSYLRYTGQAELEDVDKIANVIMRTEYSLTNLKKRPTTYPEQYFSRLGIPKNAIKMIIGRLRSDDIYNQIPKYPIPEHRSTALATQAQMIYVCLYFAPDILHHEEAAMREIVDKHFPDNWVIPMYLGYIVDLLYEWDIYNAAKLALFNTTQIKLIAHTYNRHMERLPIINKQLDSYLQEGTLTEEFILRNRIKLLEWLREANVTLRWLMLHTRRASKKIIELAMKDINQSTILLLLLKTAQFEFVLKECIQNILDQKKEKWEEARKESIERVKDLADVFAGLKPLTRVEKNEKLQAWFTKIATQIEGLDYEDKTVSGRRIQQLMKALEEVALFHQIETNVPVKNFLNETRQFLSKMIKILNISDDVMLVIDLVSEIGYGREIITEYIKQMQDIIKEDPGSVLLLRSTFLKLSSILKIVLDRISHASMGKEAMVKELFVVSEYYSNRLVDFVRVVLQIIPEMMFATLAEIVSIQTTKLVELPMRIEKEELEKISMLNERHNLAKKTFEVSQFTEGILALQTTLVGIIKVEPKALLEEGIRKILVNSLVRILDKFLLFDNKHMIEDFEAKLRDLRKYLSGFRRSFNYIQDYVNIYGLKIWQEEFQRIIDFYVEQQCNRFLKKVQEAKSRFQSKIIPIPVLETKPAKGDINAPINFIGRVGYELLILTNPYKTVYLHKMSGWFNRDEREIVGIKTFDLLIESVGVFGVNGLLKFYGYSIVKDLQDIVIKLRYYLDEGKSKLRMILSAFVKASMPLSALPADVKRSLKLYQEFMTQHTQLLDSLTPLIAQIGQKQLLRKQLSNILGFKCKLDSNPLFCSLDIMNKSLMNEIRAHYNNPELKKYPSTDNTVLYELSKYLENVGSIDPFSKIYVTAEPIDDLSAILFFITLRQVQKFTFEGHLGLKPKSKKDALDDTPFVIGMITVLKQFHSSCTSDYLGYIGQYIRLSVSEALDSNKATQYPPDTFKLNLFLEEFQRFGNLPSKIVEEFVPAFVFTEYI